MRKEKLLRCKDKKSGGIGKAHATAWWISAQLFLFSCPRSLFLCFHWVFLSFVVIYLCWESVVIAGLENLLVCLEGQEFHALGVV
jgi:hypothetical protein